MNNVTYPCDDGVGLAVVQTDDYDQWTTTPAPRRETDLGALRARHFATVADFFAEFVGDREPYRGALGVADD